VCSSDLGRVINEHRLDGLRERSTRATQEILENMGTVAVGDTLPNHAFEDIDGNVIRLLDLVDKYAVICYVMLDCEACLEEIYLTANAAGTPDEQRHFIFISDGNAVHFQRIRAKTESASRFLFDQGGRFREALQLYSFPFNIMVDDDLTIRVLRSGILSVGDVRMYARDF